MESKKLEQIKFMLGMKSEVKVLTFEDQKELTKYLTNYKPCNCSVGRKKYARFMLDQKRELLVSFVCSTDKAIQTIKETTKAKEISFNQINFEEFELIKNEFNSIDKINLR